MRSRSNRGERMSIQEMLKAANEHSRTGRLNEAERICQDVLRIDPNQAEAMTLLAILAHRQNRASDAVEWSSRAAAAKPNIAEYHANLAQFSRGVGNLQRAIAEFTRAIELKPSEPTFHNSLGTVYSDLRQYPTAEAQYRRAIELRPDYADAHNNLGGALRELDRLDQALVGIQLAIRINPNLVAAHNNLGLVLSDQGKFQDAIAAYSRAIQLSPNDRHAHWNLGMLHLLLGDFGRGWPEYLWRPPLLEFRRPQWTGGDIDGKTILLHAEQGLGDAIQFVRYAPMVAARGARVILLCHPELAALLSTAPGIDAIVPFGQSPPDFDFHCPLLDLPNVFHTTLADIPAQVPYLKPPPEPRLAPKARKLRVGLVWAGSPQHRNDARRSIALEALAPLLATDGIEFFSLQKGPMALRENHPRMTNLDPRIKTFGDTAALVDDLDLVITADTAVAHLAGALAKPVWVFLPAVPDWRWMLDRADSPWYPTMRLFRQKRRGDWSDPIDDAARELAALARQSSNGV